MIAFLYIAAYNYINGNVAKNKWTTLLLTYDGCNDLASQAGLR